jgi:5-methylcytosine-specific restriction endonuclease McrA
VASKQKREEIRMMFGGYCAYCGVILDGKFHIDHVEPVRRIGRWVKGKWVQTGEMMKPENDHEDNLFPACVKCNILKGDSNVEGFRRNLSYFARSIPTIRTYSHVHHLMRFKKLHIDCEPVVFWFETYNKEAA